jgi:hypothetical protein
VFVNKRQVSFFFYLISNMISYTYRWTIKFSISFILLYVNKIKTVFTNMWHISMYSNFRIGVQSGSIFTIVFLKRKIFLHVLSTMLWWPLRFPLKSYVRFVSPLSQFLCSKVHSHLYSLYLLFMHHCMLVSNTISIDNIRII